MKKIRIEPSPFPYYPNETYLVRLFKSIDAKVTDPIYLGAYRNGKPCGYGFAIKSGNFTTSDMRRAFS